MFCFPFISVYHVLDLVATQSGWRKNTKSNSYFVTTLYLIRQGNFVQYLVKDFHELGEVGSLGRNRTAEYF